MTDKKKVLVIDDEKDLCTLIKDLLEATGQFLVSVAYDGLQGHKLCLEEKPDLVLLDFVMPVMKGDEVIRLLKNSPDTKDIPIIVISGLGDMGYKEYNIQKSDNVQDTKKQSFASSSLKGTKLYASVAQDLGVEGYLPKPFKKEALLSAISYVLEGSSKQKKE